LLNSRINSSRKELAADDAPDSLNMLDTLLGKDKVGRENVIEDSRSGTYAIRIGDWKYIKPSNDKAHKIVAGNETGNDLEPQLYNLKDDIGETTNLSKKHPERTQKMAAKFKTLMDTGTLR
jgi:arylsulfatase A-like enzyme